MSVNEENFANRLLSEKNKKLEESVKFLYSLLSDLENIIGNISSEKNKISKTLSDVERDSFELLKLYASVQKEANASDKQKNLLIESEVDILSQLGEISQEKKVVEKERLVLEKERELLEQTSLDMARNIGEIFLEKQTIEELNKELEIKTNEAHAAKNLVTDLLNKIFPKEIAKEMVEGKVNFKTLQVTVAFSDLKQFSSYALGKRPEVIASDLKEYFNDISKILKTHSGWLVKYIGDSAMMLFGVPYLSKSHAFDAVLTAFRIKAAAGKHKLDTRFGINTGLMTVGDIGADDRPQYDAIGDAVNVAARLERYGKEVNKDIIITVDTYVRIHKYFHCEFLGNVNLKGVGEHRLYSVKGIKGIFDNDLRVNPSSLIAKKYKSIEANVSKRIKVLFPKFDFLKLESKDGSLNHSLAVSTFAVALKRELCYDDVDEDELIILSCIHDTGKLYIKSSVLKKEKLSKAEEGLIKRLLEFTLKIINTYKIYPEKSELLKEVFSKKKSTSKSARIVKIANRFDGLIFPKFYISESMVIEDALKVLKEEFPFAETDAFIKLVLPLE
jgi:class 3 adenylate cyclase